METFIVLGFCFILYEALDFFQGCYTNNNLHEQQHPQFSKDISSGQTKATTTQPLPTSTSTAALTAHATESVSSSTTFSASITTIPLSETTQVGGRTGRNSDFDLIAVDSSDLNCVDSEFGTGVVEFDDSINGDDHHREINDNSDGNIDDENDDVDDDDDDDNSDETSDSDIKTIQTNQSSSHRSSSSRIYSICDRVNHFNRRSELLIDYHCSSSASK